MLVYGGKNDNAFSYSDNEMIIRLDTPRIQEAVYNEVTSTCLDDMMLFKLSTREWSAVSQRGWRPEPRWSSAIAYNELTSQLFIFGGTGSNGSCRNDVYSCELDPNRQNFKFSELTAQINEVDQVSKRMISQANHQQMLTSRKNSKDRKQLQQK